MDKVIPFFIIIFFILGILNIFLVHIIPGIIYLVIAIIFLPKSREKLRISIPDKLMILFGIIILWGTIAVGDLFENFEGWMLS